MKKKIGILFLSFVFLCIANVKADEGMWLLTMLNKNYDDMKTQGFKLTPEDIYSVNKTSVKDAIVIFGGGCTGEIVSKEGLLFTNHHCGYGQIQQHSTVDHDYLKDGFWAANKEAELPNPGLSVKFLIKMEDVTEQILKNVDDKMKEPARNKEIKTAIENVTKKINTTFKEDDGYIVMVKSFFSSNSYYLVVYQEYKDVRFVGAPPSSIGKFGHDSDNWMWPRHTADFSIFRVYMSPDGKPAEYSKENIPFKPKHYLPVSLKGYQEGDFTFIMGFPGTTNRYMTSFGVKHTLDVANPNRIKIRTKRQEIMMQDMKADPKVKIQYASKFSRSSNYWKYSIGQNKGLKKLKVLKKKQELEKRFNEWVSADKTQNKKYGKALEMIQTPYKEQQKLAHVKQYMIECFFVGTEYYSLPQSANKLYQFLKGNDNVGKQDDIIKELKIASDKFFKDYNAPTDQKISLAMLQMFYKDVDKKYHPDFIKEIKDFEEYINNMFKNSIFVSKERFEKFLDAPKYEILINDPAFIAYKSVVEKYANILDLTSDLDDKMVRGKRLYLAGLMEMDKDKFFYPDANFTMRFTYGRVGGYLPKDGVVYDYQTTLKGVIEKAKPGDWEFDVPQKLIDLYEAKDYGIYGVDGIMPVCFTSNNDITGGNSGSPIMNAKGELLGLAFDGNWEAMSGDIAFETKLQKTINVDIRYVLFIIDKFANAKHIVDELDIRK